MSAPACPNCGAEADSSYCAKCGQQQGELVPTVGSWLSDTVGDLFLIEARLPRTVRALFWPPGRLTLEWWQGRKASFVSPLRLYLIAALPFFLVFFTASRVEERADFLEYLVGSLIFIESDAADPLPPMAPLSPAMLADSVARADWQREYTRRHSYNDSIAQVTNQRISLGVQRVFDLLPIAVGLTMVPLLALLVAIRDPTRSRFIGRLVFALHLHTVGYLLALAGVLFRAAVPVGLAGSSLYLVLARREILKESWGRASAFAAFTVFGYIALFLILYLGFVRLLLSIAPGWVVGIA